MINFLSAVAVLLIVGILLCGCLGLLNYWRTRRKPWRTKERVSALSLTAPTRNLRDLQAEVKAILQDLSSESLTLNDAQDNNDRADAYRLLGQLHTNLMQFIDAEKNYRCAIDCYNDALELEADNRIAISNKFKTVEALSELERIRF